MEQTSFNAEAFVSAWEEVWSAIACLQNFRRDLEGRVFVDILNEPDSQWQGWQAKQGKAGMTELYLGVMDALWELTPGAPIFFINGGGQGNYSGLNWWDVGINSGCLLKVTCRLILTWLEAVKSWIISNLLAAQLPRLLFVILLIKSFVLNLCILHACTQGQWICNRQEDH